jgi:uncharacterized ion transporter superfamily protein YfcC
MKLGKSNTSLQISKKTFISSILILLCLMILSGILTKIIPAGSYDRVVSDGRTMIDASSFTYSAASSFPIYRWFTAPIEVIFGPDGVMIITIILFILIIGGTFTVLDKSGVLKYIMSSIVRRFSKQKYLLLASLVFFFMLFGALLGIFEEMVALVPIVITLSYSLGWDSLTGLGMSLLAIGFGFSAAISNPFTIGIAQKISGLPLFSGAVFRIFIFLTVYAVLDLFLIRYARKIEKNPEKSLIYNEDMTARAKYSGNAADLETEELLNSSRHRNAVRVFCLFIILMIVLLLSTSFIKGLSDFSLPLMGLIFLAGGILSGAVSGYGSKNILKSLGIGMLGIAPGILLILMAMSVKYIITMGGVMDTILHYTASAISKAGPYTTGALIYIFVFLMDFFIGSGSAKAFLVMPIVAPLADLVGITRQTAVQAYCFGDGFSNMIYPTNAVLLIALGLTVVGYPKWFKWTIKLQMLILVITMLFIGLAIRMNYGPF